MNNKKLLIPICISITILGVYTIKKYNNQQHYQRKINSIYKSNSSDNKILLLSTLKPNIDKTINNIKRETQNKEKEKIIKEKQQKQIIQKQTQNKTNINQESKNHSIKKTNNSNLNKTTSRIARISRGSNLNDINLLEYIVMAEAGDEPYLGQIAVANVILNRIHSKRFPNSLERVIYQKHQFSPVSKKTLFRESPSNSVKRAVQEALKGRQVVPNHVLYFLDEKLAKDKTVIRDQKFYCKIGSHSFFS